MTSTQYEELCRRYIAETFAIPLEDVASKDEPNAKRPGGEEFAHQIDLWWETGDERIEYVHIANAKWRSSDKVDLPEVLLLDKVREEVGAHKAVMLTPTDFTKGARAAADHHRIALHVVRPEFDVSKLPSGASASARAAVVAASAEQGNPLYSFDIVHRGFEGPVEQAVVARPSVRPAPVAPVPAPAPPRTLDRGPGSMPSTNRMFTGGRGSGGRGGGNRGW